MLFVCSKENHLKIFQKECYLEIEVPLSRSAHALRHDPGRHEHKEFLTLSNSTFV